MNNKFFVPFETAKRLKEKGYNEPACHFYEEFKGGNSKLLTVIQEYTNEDLDGMPYPAARGAYCAFSAPTYHEVVDWLEEKYNIRIVISYDWCKGMWEFVIQGITYDTWYWNREETLNAAILKALEII